MTELQTPVNLDHHLSATALRRKENIFKLFYRYHSIPGLMDISGGLPHPSLFPVKELSSEAVATNFLVDPKAKNVIVSSNSDDLTSALQYGVASGQKELHDWVTKFIDEYVSKPMYKGGFGHVATNGNTDGWNKVLQVLSNEWSETDPIENRQSLLVEEFTYALSTETANVRGLNIVDIKMDRDGMIPEVLRDTLENWDPSKGKRPHIMYTISIGQNPTGATVPMERRKEIYKICCEYDIIIVDDCPYWFMQYDDLKEKCYLSVDTEGRVLRLDSFSKSFAPGCRLGWVVGPPSLIKRVYYHAEESTMHPSGYSQLMVYKVLEQWGSAGWMNWLDNLTKEYKERRDLMLAGLEPYNKIDGELILDYSVPKAGMFVWIDVKFDKHPMKDSFSCLELSRAFWVFQTQEPHPTLISPGYFYAPSPHAGDHTSSYFRLSFAPSSKTVLENAGECMGRNSHEFWKLDEAAIHKLVDEYPKDI